MKNNFDFSAKKRKYFKNYLFKKFVHVYILIYTF